MAKRKAGDLIMPTIDMDIADLEVTLRQKFNGNMEKLDDILAFVKAEVKGYDKETGVVSVEMKDTNRSDLWSVEGLARGLRGYMSQEKGLKQYQVGPVEVEVHVHENLYRIRPYIACAVVKGLKLTDKTIKNLMHLQDKLDKTFGRSRRKTSIGLYDLNLISPPLYYTVVDPAKVSFVPLGFTEEMTLTEILERHPKGQEYGHIINEFPAYPMLYDKKGTALSFPPITNSNDLGKITEKTSNLLVEVTGTNQNAVLNALNLVAMNLIDLGGKAYAAKINYPKNSDYTVKEKVTPDFSSKIMPLSVAETNRMLGLKLSSEKIAELLGVAGLDVQKASSQTVEVQVPAYRVDVMHQVDLIEDVSVAYGYNNIESLWRELPTTGNPKPDQRLLNLARDLMVGLGYQEILNYTLTNPESLFTKMNLADIEPKPIIQLADPKVVTMTCLRNWLLPGMMEFLSNNTSVEFPQKIFELGKVTLFDPSNENKTKDEEMLSAAISYASAGFSDAKSALDAFMLNFGVNWEIVETVHPSFIDGRAGLVMVGKEAIGIVGEINPAVLVAWKLENPVAAFEINLSKIIQGKLK
jgi:phenylalanyl-tRNA synthetase beta chain